MSAGDHDPSGGGRKRAGRSAFGKPAADKAPAGGAEPERAGGRGAFAKTLIATPGAPRAPAHKPAGPPEAAPGPADGRAPQRSRYTKTLLGAMPPVSGQPAVSDAPRRTETGGPQPPVPDPLREPSDRPSPARFAGGSAAPTQPQERSPRPHAAHNGTAHAAQTPRAAPTLPMNTVRAAVAESRQGGQGPAQAPSSNKDASKNGATGAFAETARKRTTGARPPSARPKPAAGSDSEPLKLQLRAFDDLPHAALNTTARVPTNRMPALIAAIVGGLAVGVLVLWMLARGSGPPATPAVVEEPAAAEPGAAQEAAAAEPPQDQAEHEAEDGQTGKAAANTSNGKAAEPTQAKAAEPKDAKASKADKPDRRAKRAQAAAARPKAKERPRRARKPSPAQRKARQPQPEPAERAPAFAPSEEDQASIEQARQALDALQQGGGEPVMRIAPSQDTPPEPGVQGAHAAPPPPPPPPPPPEP